MIVTGWNNALDLSQSCEPRMKLAYHTYTRLVPSLNASLSKLAMSLVLDVLRIRIHGIDKKLLTASDFVRRAWTVQCTYCLPVHELKSFRLDPSRFLNSTVSNQH